MEAEGSAIRNGGGANSGRPSVAVVLAAGEGIRLRPLTANRPKPMLPVATRPVLEYVLDALVESGIDELHVVVGYRAQRVQSHFGGSYGDVPITYHRQENQLGSGHALLQVRDAIDEPFIVANGDQIVDAEIVSAVGEAYEGNGPILAVTEDERASEYGAVQLSGGSVTEFVEQPHRGEYRLLNAGIYAFEPDAFDRLERVERSDGMILLPDVITAYLDDDVTVTGVRVDSFWRDATFPWDLLALNRDILARGWNELSETRPETYVAGTASIHDDATLVPPVAIEADAAVEAGAVIGPNVSVGEGATIGAGAVVRDSVVDAGTRVGANGIATQVVTGTSVRLGAGSTVAGQSTDVQLNKTIHEDILLGGVFADRADVGAGATAVSGTLVGPDVRVAQGATVDGQIPGGAEVIR